MRALAIILAALVPPAGVFLHKGISAEFWISFALTLAFFLPGMVYSLVIVLRR